MTEVISIPGFADPFSSLSHLFGAMVFAALGVILCVRGRGDGLRMVGLIAFSLGAVLLLATSGVYHLFQPTGYAHRVLQRIDHAAIFLLIAASFTPVHILLFRGWGRWGVLLLIWAIAILGITLKSIYFEQISPQIGTAMYIGMGWIGLGSWVDLIRRYGFQFALPLMFSGFTYTVGAVLDSIRWPVLFVGVFQAHELFHVAVLIGLGLHWAFVYSIATRATNTPLTDL